MKIYDKEGTLILDIAVDDNSYRYRAIMGEHSLTLYYSLAEHVEIPLGAYCDYQGERYTLERPEALKMQHSRMFNYTVTMEAVEVLAKRWKFRNPVDGRLKFTLTAKPHEHLQMFVDNMNARDGGWTVGDCVTGVETMISYDHAYCSDALAQMAAEFKTEYEFNGKRVSLRKLEYNKDNPLPLSYGKGNGFKSGVGRTNEGDTPPIEILYTQGGSDNIDPSKYGSTELLLPKGQTLAYDGDRFEGEDGFDAANARTYATDEAGMSIRRSDKAQSTLTEDSLDCTSIYPKRVGTVSAVVTVDAEKNFYDFTDATIPQALDYEACLIAGETMTVIFQSGMLAGREFDVKYYHEAVTEEDGTSKAARRFEIVPQEIDGQTMPNGTFCPGPGDTYAVFHCMLPDAYICDNATKSGASWDMFRAGVKYLFDNEEVKFSFTGELDGIWSKKDWVNIGGKIKLGGYILFSDPRFQPEGVRVRITGVKDYINKPYSPVIELSNTTVTGGVSSTLKDLVSQEVVNEERHKEALRFTRRRFRDAQETLDMLEKAMLDNFTGRINPITVQTMAMLVGDESLQFRFVSSKTNPVQVPHSVVWDNDTKQLTAESGILQHMTLGISSLSSSHGVSEYKYWNISSYVSARLEEADNSYYLYAKVSKTAQTGVFLLSEKAIKMEEVAGYYHLLVGILNSEYNGERSFVTLYGFTEILPGRITTDRVVSADGQSYFDFVSNSFKLGSKLVYNNGILKIDGAIEWGSLDSNMQNKLNGYATTQSLGEALQNYATYDSLDEAVKDKVSTSTLTEKLKSYALTSALKNYATTADLNGKEDSGTANTVLSAFWKALKNGDTTVYNGVISTEFIDASTIVADYFQSGSAKIANFTIETGQLTGGNGAGISVYYRSGGTTYQAKLGWGTRSSNGGSTIFWSDNASIGKLYCDEIVCYDYIRDGCLFKASSGGLGVLVGGSGLSGNGIWGKNNSNTGNLYLNSGAPSSALVKITNCSCSDASDERIKTIFYDVPNVLYKLEGISAFYYTFYDDEDKILYIGVSAQAVKEVFPEAVTLIMPDSSDSYYGVNYVQLLTAVGINGLKELHAKVKALENRVAELEK